MMTKALDGNQLAKLMGLLNLKVLEGRAAAAPELTKDQQDVDMDIAKGIEEVKEIQEGEGAPRMRRGGDRGEGRENPG